MSNKKYINYFIESIKKEFSFFPCLGLVSKRNSGSHKDMNYNTFVKSLKIFKPMFKEISNNLDVILTFSDLKQIGKKYEDLMFKKTNNINTHKGLIFHSSIFFYCFLRAMKENISLPEFISNFCTPLKNLELKSKSMQLCSEYNLKHPIQIAYEGYAVVFQGLGYLKEISKSKIDKKLILFSLLIHLTILIDDTTLILKIGLEEVIKLKEYLVKLNHKILNNEINYKQVLNENQLLITKNVSPGGAADLLVMVLFLDKVNYF